MHLIGFMAGYKLLPSIRVGQPHMDPFDRAN
jgi:hypothetical protein